MNYLIYLAYGSAAIRSEALYSILSYDTVAEPGAATLLIYTDDAIPFQQVLGRRSDITYPTVSAEQWQAWRGAVDKVYLLKIGVLAHAAQHYPGHLLFLDTDTIWLKDPAPLFVRLAQGSYLMHLNEGELGTGNALSRKVYRHLRGHTFQVSQYTVQVKASTRLFNSGVIGFRSEAAGILPEVLKLAEQLYATYNKHMMEQLAFSLRFAVERPIEEVASYLMHYWNLKGVRPALTRIFTAYPHASPAELYERATRLQLPTLHTAELAYRNLPGWRRTLRKLTGRKWRLPELEA